MGDDLTTERFKEERQRIKLSHAAVGDICGVAKTSVIAWEKGAKIPAEALSALFTAKVGFDYQYVITGTRWGQFGPQDAVLANLAGPERAKAALDRVLTVQTQIGGQFTSEQLQTLVGYAYEHAPTVEALAGFVRAALALVTAPAAAGQAVTGHGNIVAGGDVTGVKIGAQGADRTVKNEAKKNK